MQASNGSIIASVIICAAILLIAQVLMTPDIPEIDIPTADAIAASVLAGVTVPTAEDIADAIDIPEGKDTWFSIIDDEDAVAEELALDYLNEEDFLEGLANFLATSIIVDCNLYEDFNEDDIKSIDVRDVEVDKIYPHSYHSNDRKIVITAVVNVDDDGDDEKVKVDITMDVIGLDRDDDYEDAEVDEDTNTLSFRVVKVYNDFCSLSP